MIEIVMKFSAFYFDFFSVGNTFENKTTLYGIEVKYAIKKQF